MADSDEPSLKDRQNEPELILQDLPQAIPSFVHVLPCTNPTVIYLERLDGCTTGLHLTREDTQGLHELYSKMGNAIMAKDKSLDGATLDGCSLPVCKTRTMLGPMSLVHYMENCAHYFHYGCLVGLEVARPGCSQLVDCPCCKVPSTRALLWPKVFPDIATKNEIFQLQKLTFGIDVAPRTALKVNKYYVDENLYPVFDLCVKDTHVSVRKRHRQKGSSPSKDVSLERISDYSTKQPTGGHCPEQAIIKVTEAYIVQAIQRLCLANQPNTFYLGDILPIEENGAFQVEYGLKPPLDDFTRRQKLLLQFKCPFARVGVPNGERCSQGRDCEFWHGWPNETPAFIVQQVKIRHFPPYFCLHNSRKPHTECVERIRVHPNELARCLTGLHPSTQDLQNLDAFAHRMAKHIMEPVVDPEIAHDCAYCHTVYPDSVWIHMQNCVHWLHAECFPLVREDNANSKLELHCPACFNASVRFVAWPGPFPSDNVKQTIFNWQLAEFKLTVQTDTKLRITERSEQVFTLDYGGAKVVTIDLASHVQGSTIWYD